MTEKYYWIRLIFLPFIIMLQIGLGQDHPGIHQLQSEYYKQHYIEKAPEQYDIPILAKRTRTVTPSREIFGYHPYWMGTAWQNYNYNLLTTIAFFSAEADSAGGFSDLHGWPVTGLTNQAHANGVDVVLCVTLFSNSAITTLLSSATYRQNLIDNILTQVQAGNADGVNIDFEAFPTSQKQNMVQFITDLTSTLHSSIPGSQVTLAMPAVDWNNAWDYNTLASICDGLFIMGYDYHWSGSSTTGAVAPLSGGTYNVTWTVNDYLNKTNSQTDKIILGCAYYGYEWPASSGQAGANTIGSGTARFYSAMKPLAWSYGKLWDANSQTPWYHYQDSNWIQGWYDDSLSLSLKYDFTIEQNLKGVGMWALGYDGSNTELWDALANKFGAFYAPTTPGDLSIRNIGNGSIIIDFTRAQTASLFIVLRSDLDGTNSDTLGIFIQRPIVINGLTQGEVYYLRVVAANDVGSSPVTEMLGIVPSNTSPDVLIVNGFDRVDGTNNTFDFIRQHGSAIHNSGKVFDAASNEAVISGSIDLNDYDIIDWILGEEGTATSSFSGAEQTLIMDFLENGGFLFVSGSEIGYDLVAQGTTADQQFYENYLKADYISDAAGSDIYTTYGENGSLLDGVTNITFDDGTHGTYDVDWPDGIKPVGEAGLCAKYSNVDYDSRGGAGIYYNGSFGSSTQTGALVYLAIGFEAIYPESKRNEVMNRIIAYFEQFSDGTEEDDSIIPELFGITAIYPNPSNSSVTIILNTASQAANNPGLEIVDLLGRTILSKTFSATGSKTIQWIWNGRLSNGQLAPTGIYFVVLEANHLKSVKKFSLIK